MHRYVLTQVRCDSMIFIFVDLINHQSDSIFCKQLRVFLPVVKRNIVELLYISVDFDSRVPSARQIQWAEAIKGDSRENSAERTFYASQIIVPLTSDLDVSLVVENRHFAQLLCA